MTDGQCFMVLMSKMNGIIEANAICNSRAKG
jgi:hypothetical protein